MLLNWRNPEHEPLLRAVMQIAGNEPATREKLLRTSLVAAQLMGLAFMRFVWKIEPLASMDDEHRRRDRTHHSALPRRRYPPRGMMLRR